MRMLIIAAAFAAGLVVNVSSPAQAEECTGNDCASQQQGQQSGGHDCHSGRQITS